MRLSVIGCGYLGAVHAAAMASLGHDVVGIDVDPNRIEALSRGYAPFFEPGLPELLEDGLSTGKLRFSTDVADAHGARVHFVAVGTPQSSDGSADLSYVKSSLESLLPHLEVGDVVAGKSTVPVGTAALLETRVENTGATLVWNPEFLREGFAVKDTIAPDRIVVGLSPGPRADEAVSLMREVFSVALDANTPFLTMDLATAELVKVAANAFLATKISFINAVADVAEVAGADITQLAEAIGLDERIGRRFLGAGIGFGGGCLPKDIRAFTARAEELGRGESVKFLREVDRLNMGRRDRAVGHALKALGGDVTGRRITVLGAAFKPNSDDVRDSPGLDVAAKLHNLGAIVRVTDPEAIENAQRLHPELEFVSSTHEALRGADLVMLVTEWEEYKQLDAKIVASLTSHQIMVDGRNALSPREWREEGWTYIGMGRK